jgi:NDP-sugar pyrophosphorylase family protein
MIVGVVPAAGRATRLQPLPCSKEVLPVRGRPVMEHLLDRLRAAGADEIRVVTRAEKRDVIALAEAAGAIVVTGEPPTVPASLALGVEGLAPEDVVLFGFPDTLWEPQDAFATLAAELDGWQACLGVFRSAEPERGDGVEVAADGRVLHIRVKSAEAPTNLVWGCLAAPAGALAGVDRHQEVSDHLRTLRIRAVVFDSEFVDVGTREALAAVEAST